MREHVIPASEVRNIYHELINQVAYQNKRFIITRRGKPVAALVSIEELRVIEGDPVFGECPLGFSHEPNEETIKAINELENE